MVYIGGLAFSATNQVRINDIPGPDLIVQITVEFADLPKMEIRLKTTAITSMDAGDFMLI